jgi:hypothetical protein
VSTLDFMAKDRHKRKSFQLRLHDLLRVQLEKLAERNASSLTTEASIAIRERLERAGLWPPPPAPEAPKKSKGGRQ